MSKLIHFAPYITCPDCNGEGVAVVCNECGEEAPCKCETDFGTTEIDCRLCEGRGKILQETEEIENGGEIF